MTYLITGGNSFLGVALSKLLLSEGHDVIIACRETSKCSLAENKHLRIIRYKGLENIKSLKDAVNHADIFVHLAWSGTDRVGRNSKVVQQANVLYSMDALSVAKAIGCALFVEAGSQAEYGIVTGLITEETSCKPVTEYGKAKLEFGNKAKKWCFDNGMKFIHLRILSVFGIHDHERTLVKTCIRKMLDNEDVLLSSCRQLWNYVDEDDAARQIFLLTEHALCEKSFKAETYLIGSYDTRRLRSFVEEMKILSRSKSKLLFGELQGKVVSLDPCIDKTAKATGGFIASKSFGDVVKEIVMSILTIPRGG